ncbi:MAG: hypothetical protein AAFW75_04000 [Cyanobacteria bacterium J06636_16]
MATMSSSHAVALDLIDSALRRLFGIGYYIRQRKPFIILDSSEPEPIPDVAVVPGLIRDRRLVRCQRPPQSAWQQRDAHHRSRESVLGQSAAPIGMVSQAIAIEDVLP